MQINVPESYDHLLAERIVEYLQTRDSRIFPFTRNFTSDQQRAFIRDLREGLAELTDSGSKKGTSATGYVMRDTRVHQIVMEWATAGGDWPIGAFSEVGDSSLGASGEEYFAEIETDLEAVNTTDASRPTEPPSSPRHSGQTTGQN